MLRGAEQDAGRAVSFEGGEERPGVILCSFGSFLCHLICSFIDAFIDQVEEVDQLYSTRQVFVLV